MNLLNSARILIIGGGFAGAATAYELSRRGMTGVVLVEREQACGYHASGRNAALGRQLTEHDSFTELTVAGMEFLRSPPDGFSDMPVARETGSILVVDTADQLDAMMAGASRWGLPCEAITMRELYGRWPLLQGLKAAGGVYFPTDGVIDVHAALQGFLRGTRARGSAIAVRCEVVDIRRPKREGSPVEVITNQGVIHAGIVVNAAGAWVEALGRAAGAEPPHYAPIRRHLFITEAVAHLDHGAPFVWHVGRHEFYVRPERTGYLLSGCDETEVAPCDAVPAADAVEALAAKLTPLAPELAELGIARAWACLRTFTPDRHPIIDWDSKLPWLFWVAGLGGHGATASAAVGARAAERILARL